MTPKQMYKLRLEKDVAKQRIKKRPLTIPLQKEIQMRREEMIREVLDETKNVVKQQIRLANLTVSEDSKNNDTVLKSTNSLLDRVFGAPIKSIDLQGDVNFSLRSLSKEADKFDNAAHLDLIGDDEYGEL